jgi:RNA polymerase-binding transcription factor DksA
MSAATNPELTPDVLAELRVQLEQQRDQLKGEIAAKRREEGAGDTPDEDPAADTQGDAGDESVDLEEWDTTQQVTLDLETQLAEVEHALGKFATGDYGVCENCGRPIPLARLRVLPWARYDVEHEAQLEAQRPTL